MKLVLLIIYITLSTINVAEEIQYEDELHAQLKRTSDISYKNYIKSMGGDLPDYNGWKEIISKTFRILSEKSGHETFPIVFSIINNPEFNAFAYPTGQFIIHSGTLEYLDKEIGTLPQKEKEIYRGNYISAILSHELAHYYNSHTFNLIKRNFNSEAGKISNMENIKFQQEDELEADINAYMLMKKGGYDTNYLIKVIKILNRMRQDALEVNKNSLNLKTVYLSTHPSPHERLAQLENDEKELHKFASTMEKVYSDIQIGKNLEKSIDIIKKALITYEDNPELLKILAISYHKLWEKSVTLRDLQVKSIINVPAFRDRMIFSPSETKKSAVKKIPGDKNMYYKALELYKKINSIAPENYFLSNYTVLLAYAETEKDEKEAINLAEKLYSSTPGIQYANNLGVVYHITRNPQKALEFFKVLVKTLDKEIFKDLKVSKDSLSKIKSFQDDLKLKTQLDPDYIYTDSTPVLNLALLELDHGDKTEGKNISQKFLEYYDSNSKWAGYLAEKSELNLPTLEVEAQSIEIAGIKLGDTMKNLLSKWKIPDRKDTLDSEEIWYYTSNDAKVTLANGFIVEIELNGKNSPVINRNSSKLLIGTTKALAEEVLGECKKENNFYIYYKYGYAAAFYRQDKLKNIIFYK